MKMNKNNKSAAPQQGRCAFVYYRKFIEIFDLLVTSSVSSEPIRVIICITALFLHFFLLRCILYVYSYILMLAIELSADFLRHASPCQNTSHRDIIYQLKYFYTSEGAGSRPTRFCVNASEYFP